MEMRDRLPRVEDFADRVGPESIGAMIESTNTSVRGAADPIAELLRIWAQRARTAAERDLELAALLRERAALLQEMSDPTHPLRGA